MVNHAALKVKNKLYFLILISLFNCKQFNNEAEIIKSEIDLVNYNQTSFNSIYEIKKSKSIEEWIDYIELNEFIEQLNSADYSSIIDGEKYLIRFFNRIKNSIPENLKKPEIISRLTVIETNFLRFESILSNYEVDNSKKISVVERINSSFSNLNFQIDKLIEKQEITADQ